MWEHNYTPVGDSLVYSTLISAIPLGVLFYLLGVRRKPSWVAGLSGLGAALVLAVGVYGMPVPQAAASMVNGAAFGLFPIGWIVIASLILYRVTLETGKFEIIKDSIGALSDDRRLQAVLIGFAFGAFIEGRGRVRHPGGGGRGDADRARLSSLLRGVHLPARQHRAGRLRVPGDPGRHAGERHRPAGGRAELDDRTPVRP